MEIIRDYHDFTGAEMARQLLEDNDINYEMQKMRKGVLALE